MASFYASSSKIGVDLQNAGTTQLFGLGERVEGTNNSVWVYCQASTSVTAYMVVAMNTAGACGMASALDVTHGLQLGVAQTAIAAESYAWIPIKGSPFNVMTTGSCTVGPAYVAASSIGTGMTSSTASGSLTLVGFQYLTVQSTNTVTVATCVLTYPCVQLGLSV
jgi:hypothetical protein